MNSVEFENKKYQVRQVKIDDIGLVNIASTNLNDKLILENGAYKSNEATYIDEQIYFFVEPIKLKLSNKDLIEHIKISCT